MICPECRNEIPEGSKFQCTVQTDAVLKTASVFRDGHKRISEISISLSYAAEAVILFHGD